MSLAMDSIQEIALSKIADILSSTNIIAPKVDIWKKIFNNAGLSDNFELRAPQFKTKEDKYGYGENEVQFYHNDKCYNALYETFKELQDEQEELKKLLNSIANKISIRNIFSDNIERKIKKNNYKIRNMDIIEYLEVIDLIEKNQLLNEYANKSFNALRHNFNILELDFSFDKDEEEQLCIIPFTDGIRESSFDNNILLQWLSKRYPNIEESYIKAMKAYSMDDGVGCISHCRNIITGIFTYEKDEQKKWFDGLKKACKKDKNINNINVNDIPKVSYNINSPDVNNRYQYPRYNLIYRLYCLTCALGAHKNEGNLNNGTVDFEEVKIEDAFMTLRITEDVLIWLYQSNEMGN